MVEIEGVTLHLAHPDELAVHWVGQDELMRQLLAAWMVVNEQDLPMNPRLLGKPVKLMGFEPERFPWQRTGDWNAPLFVMGGVFLVGALAWCFIDPRRPIFAHAPRNIASLAAIASTLERVPRAAGR